MPSGRKARNVEFMGRLMDVFGYDGVSEFARACGKKTSNMSRYLRGTLYPGESVLRTSVTHLAWISTARDYPNGGALPACRFAC